MYTVKEIKVAIRNKLAYINLKLHQADTTLYKYSVK